MKRAPNKRLMRAANRRSLEVTGIMVDKCVCVCRMSGFFPISLVLGMWNLEHLGLYLDVTQKGVIGSRLSITFLLLSAFFCGRSKTAERVSERDREQFFFFFFLIETENMLRLSLVFLVVVLVDAASQKRPGLFGFMGGRSYDVTDEETQTSWKGSGREFDLFDTRTKDDSVLNDDKVVDSSDNHDNGLFKAMPASKVVNNNHNHVYDDDDDDDDGDSLFKTVPASATRSPSRREYYGSSRGKSTPTFLHNVQEWWSTNLPNFPQLKCRLEPTTTLKIRKTFRPLKTIVRLGADFNTQLGVWQFKSSWEDAIIGGKLTLAGRELQLTKSWQLSMGKSALFCVCIYVYQCLVCADTCSTWLLFGCGRSHGRFGDTVAVSGRRGFANHEGVRTGGVPNGTVVPH